MIDVSIAKSSIMKRQFFTFAFGIIFSSTVNAQLEVIPTTDASPFVDYEVFMKLVVEVEPHRKERLITIEEFNAKSQNQNTLILDTRSREMYNLKHVKGAIHLNFSDFTQQTLEALVPDTNTTILIYCNNNFQDDEVSFPTKMYVPPTPKHNELGITMALNIPTYINLYGYGYKNVYELKELISVFDSRVQFEGSSISVITEQ